MAARLKIILQESAPAATPGITVYRYILWADVPAARQVRYVTTETSAWPQATGADNAAIQNGSVVERVETIEVMATDPLAALEAKLQVRWQGFQDQINGSNPWRFSGTTWDGTTWTVVNNS